MEFAVHIRNSNQTQTFHDILSHLKAFYEPGALEGQNWSDLMAADSLRIYIGNEFCVHRLPSLEELQVLCRLAQGENRTLTFVTPPLTDEGMDRCGPLFNFLEKWDPQTEVVVNDWGVHLFLKQQFPAFRLSVGRLLNKGFKDPRLMNPTQASQFSAETAALFNQCTFDSVDFRAKMQELKVMRLERDLLPYGDPDLPSHGDLETSVYFPFGYITTGRVCWPASFKASAEKKYAIANGCRRPCNQISLNLNHAKTHLKLIQAGNTIFYLYAPPKLATLVRQAKTRKLRLVYQGLIL